MMSYTLIIVALPAIMFLVLGLVGQQDETSRSRYFRHGCLNRHGRSFVHGRLPVFL